MKKHQVEEAQELMESTAVQAEKELEAIRKEADSLVVKEAQGQVMVMDDSNIDTSESETGIELKKTKLGKFESPTIAGLSFAEKEVIIVGGKLNYTMWGNEEKNPDHKSKFFLQEDSLDKAKTEFNNLADSLGLREDGYTFQEDVKEGYTLMMLDVETGAPYYIHMSKSGKKEFLNYNQGIKYKQFGNQVNRLSGVITRLSIQEMKGGSFTWLCEKFDFVEDAPQK